MAYIQQIRRRAANRMADKEDIVKREPQNASGSQAASQPQKSSAQAPTVAAPQSTFFSVVFVTASPTFTGDVAGYTTLTDNQQESQQQQQTQETQQTQQTQQSSAQPETTQQQTTTQQAAPTSQAPTTVPTSTQVSATDLGSLTVASSTAVSSYVPYTRSATRSYINANPTGSSDASNGEAPKGMSAGGKAGLAIGILLIIGLLAGGVLFFFWKKKKENKHQALDDEKVGGYSGPIAAAARAQGAKSEKSNAPRLSLRPVTQFAASLGNAGKRLSQNPHTKPNQPTSMAAAGTNRNLTGPGQNPFQDPPANPFGDQNKANPPTPNVTITPPASDADGSVAGGALAAAGLAGGKGQPRAAPGPGGPQPNVHRVQLDFKPSMDDEIELKAGQLIRVMHEYDDGWALCVRMDRSQQGVAPRTCLSARPVKPRPNNGRPMSPAQSRPMTPNGQRPMSPAGGPGPRSNSPALSHGPSRPGTSQSNRAMSPPNQAQQPMPTQPGQFNQAPRPLSPGPVPRSPVTTGPKRSQSPGPYGAESGPAPMSHEQRRRSNSAGGPMRGNRGSPPNVSPISHGDPMAGWRPPRPGQGY